MSTSRLASLCVLLPALTLAVPPAAAAAENVDAISLQASVEGACALAEQAHLSVGGECTVANFERQALTADVFEYSVDVRVGPAEHDVIGLHRVVRESAPYRAVQTSKAVMMVHGDAWGF